MTGDNENHSLDNFKVPTSDDKGHNIHLTFRCMPIWSGHLDKVVVSGKFPYTNRGDIIRHAIQRHMHWLEGMEEVPGSVLGQIQLIIDLMEDDKRQQGFEDAVTSLQERVAYHMGNGDLGEARKHVLSAIKCVEEMPNGFWKDKFRREVRKNNKKLLDTAPKIKFGDVEEEVYG